MGEFVGIDPLGADKLIRQMETGKDVLGRTRPGLESAIAEAGADWAGRAGVTAMHRTWWFFHESQQDLKWRVDTLKRMVPTQQKGMLTATMPFSNQTEAAQAAKKDAAAITKALKHHDEHLSGQSWAEVEKAAAALKGRVDDPAYAAALLAALGPTAFQKLFRDWMNNRAAADRRGLIPQAAQRAGDGLPGLLAKAFASAESSGRLRTEWQKMVETAPSDILTALVTLAPQSSAFLTKVATNLLNRPPNSDAFPTDPNWNLYNLARAFAANPEAFQRFLAEHPKEAATMLDAYTIRSTGVPAYEQALAEALHGALKPDSGTAEVRERAWLSVINSIGADNTLWVGGSLGTFANSPVSRMLAQNIKPILDHLARGQATRNSPKMPHLAARPPWDKLDPAVSARFMGALMQDSAAADTLMKAAKEYTKELDMGRFHPFDPDNYKQEAHVNLAERTGALANLLLAGSTYAEWSDDEYAERIAGYMLMPVDYLDQYFPVASKIVSTGKAKGLDEVKDLLKDMITDYLDKKTPDTAETVAGKLIDEQIAWLDRSLREHGLPAMTTSQQALMRDAMEGRVQGALLDALKRRGG
ncbi:hypothetical protein [Nonomuraea gerenzanensis]|uniref:Uncharacterized protein n=1 Tax=Nonomuraea gerenzanensis TaxID=93944 RepID=A0A1M4EQH0_9ACTN|nr:hypothetical protein [Nonomuraea gerenzanensis]UBU12530.1 hypothetical protein LCN96_51105 [Nonomuraea gerenzanensis]SBP01086.1 hypothetical protein BN4615_P10602 [Nonomuraea gerenzanensis]